VFGGYTYDSYEKKTSREWISPTYGTTWKVPTSPNSRPPLTQKYLNSSTARGTFILSFHLQQVNYSQTQETFRNIYSVSFADMGVLTEVPDFRFFSTLPDLHDLLAEDPKATTNKIPPTFQDIIGKIFLKHKMTNDFGVIFVHRHFQMGENEILVETFSADQSISLTTPWMVQKCKYYYY